MILYLVYLIAGLLLFLASVNHLRKTRSYIRRSERALGRVVRLEEESDTEGTAYRPIFEFTTLNHEIITYRHHTASSPSRWPLGTERTFLYAPADPAATVQLLSYSLFGMPVFFLAIALTLMVTGAGYFLVWGNIA